ncbi:unnamed protein product, partial [Ilex paraguariensis]
MVKEWKGMVVGLNRVVEREASVAEQRWERRSKAASWCMSLWMWGMSEFVARRIRAKSGWPSGWSPGSVRLGSGVEAGGGGGAAAAIFR